jgi:predicted O-methyltransferase YrrM
MIRSSYIANNYGAVLKAYVINWRPTTLVELGILDGYSTIAITEAVKEMNFLYEMQSKLQAYDLFDDYEFKHGSKEEVEKLIKEKGLSDCVDIHKGDAYKVHTDFSDDSVQFLHVDISNTGETLRTILTNWAPKLIQRGLVLFEGGSEERDNNEWMVKYNKPSIKKEMETNKFINDNYIYGTYYAYPSMTVFLKRWG